jgi:geranylgeranyl diphosphate synthase type II
MRTIKDLQSLFNDALQEQQFKGTPTELYEPFTYILSLGGKRMRPVMLLHACEMFCGESIKALPQAIAIELFHNFTLIHDDIMDRAPLRRGLPAVHKKYNSTVAILVGDAMLLTAYKYLVKCDPQLVSPLINLFNDCGIKICEGQQLDMNFEKSNTLEIRDYLGMVELKTAYLFATALQMGAIIGGASESDANHLFNFGKYIGISFQIKDDWLDSFGTVERIGKQSGGDILRNKKTFLFIKALSISDDLTKGQLKSWFSGEQVNDEEKVSAILKIYSRLGIDEVSRSEMESNVAIALQHLSRVSLTESQKKSLAELAKDLLVRNE